MSLLAVVRRDPRVLGYARSRWTLSMIREECDWLNLRTDGGLGQVLERLGIHYKRGQDYLHSPDRHYQEKVSLIQLAHLRAWYDPERYVLVYLDEITYGRQPRVSYDYAAAGSPTPQARRSYQSDTQFRGVGALNAVTGQVTYRQHSHITLRHLSDFFAALRSDYPHAELLYVALDNWPIHFHPDVLVRLQPQNFPFPPRLPASWPSQPSSAAVVDTLPIQLLCLPTYASWLNPIEKLWRSLRQDVLHLHRLANDWPLLKQEVLDFMHTFTYASPDLLRYVGLLSD